MPVIENTAMRYNLIPLEVSFEKESGHWFLRIFIYSSDHPVNHSDCEHITRGLGDLLDELIPFKYYLEVSSPGLDWMNLFLLNITLRCLPPGLTGVLNQQKNM